MKSITVQVSDELGQRLQGHEQQIAEILDIQAGAVAAALAWHCWSSRPPN